MENLLNLDWGQLHGGSEAAGGSGKIIRAPRRLSRARVSILRLFVCLEYHPPLALCDPDVGLVVALLSAHFALPFVWWACDKMTMFTILCMFEKIKNTPTTPNRFMMFCQCH